MADPMELISEAEGKSLTTVFKQGIGGFLLALSVSFIAGFQAAIDFLFLPFEIFVDVAWSSVDAFLLTPMGITVPAYEISAEALPQFGLFAGPVGTGIAMAGLLIVIGYLALSITSNWLPGTLVDNPVWDRLFGTPEEEADDED